MKLEDGSLGDGVFPRRRPLLAILVVCAIAAYPAYRLSLFGYGRLQPRGVVSGVVAKPGVADLSAAPAADEASARSVPSMNKVAPMDGSDVLQNRAATTSALNQAASSRVIVTNKVVSLSPLAQEKFTEILRSGQDHEGRGELTEARTVYAEALRSGMDERQRSTLQDRLGKINIELLFSKQNMIGKVAYVVKPNDAVEKIARKSGTTKELICRINGLGSNGVIRVGQTMTLFTGKFSIVVTKHSYELLLSAGGEFFKRYSVCIGAENKTPLGSFIITEKEVNPTWWPAGQGPIPGGDQRNLLGTRWMATKDTQNPSADKRGIGIHGTKDENSIGKSESAGCIRMLNADVEELYMLVPVGTPVIVAE